MASQQARQAHWAHLMSLPTIHQLPLDRIGGPPTYPPANGELQGRDVVNASVQLTWTDGHQEQCRALVRAWTPTAVLVWADSTRGQHVAWVDPAAVTPRCSD